MKQLFGSPGDGCLLWSGVISMTFKAWLTCQSLLGGGRWSRPWKHAREHVWAHLGHTHTHTHTLVSRVKGFTLQSVCTRMQLNSALCYSKCFTADGSGCHKARIIFHLYHSLCFIAVLVVDAGCSPRCDFICQQFYTDKAHSQQRL